MPTVPIYDAPQVRPGPTPTPQIAATIPNYGAAVGQGLQQAAGTLADVQLQAAHQAAQQVVQEKLNQFQTYRNGWDEQIQTLDGEKIKDPEYYGGQAGESLATARARDTQDQYQKLVEGMNPLQRRMFDQHALPAMEQDRHRTEVHEFAQIQKIKLDTLDAGMAVAGQTAETAVEKNGNFGWSKFDDAVTQARQLSQQKSAALGLTGDLADLAEKSAVSGVVQRAATQLLLRSNSTDAQKLVESYSEIMTPEVRDHFLAKAKGVNDANTATDEGNTALALATNNTLRTVDLPKIKAQLERKNEDGTFVLAPEVRQRAKDQAEHDAAALTHNWAVQDEATLQPVFRALMEGKTSRSALLAQVEHLPLSAKAATDAAGHIHSWFAQRRAELRQDMEPILSPLQKAQQNLAYYNTITDPSFAGMTDQQILAKVPELGLANTTQLMQDLYSVRNNPAKINEIHLDKEVAESAAKEFGIFTGDKPNDAEKLKIATMQAQAKAIIQASGQKAWPYDKQRELYRNLAQQVITDRTFLGFPWESKSPFFQVRQTTPIPPTFLKTLQDEAKAQGLAMPSDATVYQLWFDARGKGLVDEKGNRTKTAPTANAAIVTGATK